jgi:hypothetical protein
VGRQVLAIPVQDKSKWMLALSCPPNESSKAPGALLPAAMSCFNGGTSCDDVSNRVHVHEVDGVDDNRYPVTFTWGADFQPNIIGTVRTSSYQRSTVDTELRLAKAFLHLADSSCVHVGGLLTVWARLALSFAPSALPRAGADPGSPGLLRLSPGGLRRGLGRAQRAAHLRVQVRCLAWLLVSCAAAAAGPTWCHALTSRHVRTGVNNDQICG